MSKTYDAQERYRAKQERKGLTRVTVWVPESKRDDLSKYAKKLRRRAASS